MLGISLVIFYFAFDGTKLSTNVLDLFPKVDERDLLDIHKKLEDSNQILIYTKDSIKPLESLSSVNFIDRKSVV